MTLDFEFAISWPDPIPPPGQKQVARNYVYSSHIVLNNPVSRLTDAQLWQIVQDAYRGMSNDMQQYGLSRNTKSTPLAMSILAWDHEIILASSQKGPNSFSYEVLDTPVKEALQRCQAAARDGPTGVDKPHKMQGKCGEEMAAHLYYLFNQGRPLKDRGAVVGTFGADTLTSTPRQKDPCGAEGEVSSR